MIDVWSVILAAAVTAFFVGSIMGDAMSNAVLDIFEAREEIMK